ncbi:striatin homolog [Condylostylus longicornis]|uniref:striatin homolog n=1 Tax=Condylostylus longicornis TaxID=2530218 RepID=UPI00244D9B0B|nr:striatin homolog [Condylostylus longicornis]
MASVKDTASFFANGNTKQFDYCYKLYPEILKLKAEARSKKPEELIKLDNWYQHELPKLIRQRGKDAHMVHEELVQCMKWKQSRGKYYPQLSYLIKVNTPRAVMQETKKAFRKLPNLELAITALSNLKGVGTTMASALLAAAAPDHAPFMADECLMAIPEIEGIDYTTKEYLNFVQHIQTTVDRLNSEKDSSSSWTPHRVELALWTHYVARDLKPELLDDMPNQSMLVNPSNKFSGISGEEDENEDSVIHGVVTGVNDSANTTDVKQTNGGGNGDGNGDGGGGIDSASITTDENSISNDSQDAVIDSANNTQTSIDNNKISETSSTDGTTITTTDKTNTEHLQPIIHNSQDTNNELNTLQPIHHHQSHDEIPSPMLLVNDDTTTASSTTVEEDNTTTTTGGEPLNTVISDESNLEPPPLQQNPVEETAKANGNNNGNGALDSLDESSTRSEDDSLEKPLTKCIPTGVDENSDSLSSAKRSIDCCDSESNSQPESKKIRSD